MALVLTPAIAIAEGGCKDGVCGRTVEISPSSGAPGTEATLTISTGIGVFTGDFEIWLSKTSDFLKDSRIVLTTGKLGKEGVTEVTVSFTIPETSYGQNFICFYREHRPDDPLNAQFYVNPGMKVSTASAQPRSTVTITGSGFTSEDEGELSFDGETVLAITTDKNGSFSASFEVPDTATGDYALIATAEQLFNKDATTSLTIIPGITLEPDLPEIGTEATVAGYGFAAGSVIHVNYDDISVVSSPTTDDTGNFSTTFVIPPTSEDDHIVTVTDEAGNTATLNLSLEKDPPSTPFPLSPTNQRFGFLGAEEVTFNWSSVSDPSGITYTLEVAENLGFFPLILRRADLTELSYTTRLESGNYFWRIKASDGAGNPGPWAISGPFKIGFFPVWSLVIAGFIAFIFLTLLIRAFYRLIRNRLYYY